MLSSRLPGKALIEIGGKPILGWVLHRLSMCDTGPVVVATSRMKEDNPIAAWCKRNDIRCFRGHHQDVLSRFYHCADLYPDADTVVRVTADCPLLCPNLLTETLAVLDGNAYSGVVGAPAGFGQEAFTVDALHESWELATEPADREHVVTYMLDRPDEFPQAWVRWDGTRTTGWRFTLDTGQDLVDLAALYAMFGSGLFDMDSYQLTAEVGVSVAA